MDGHRREYTRVADYDRWAKDYDEWAFGGVEREPVRDDSTELVWVARKPA